MRVSAREPDPGVSEAILGIVYSAHRTEVKGATDASGRLTVTEGPHAQSSITFANPSCTGMGAIGQSQ